MSAIVGVRFIKLIDQPILTVAVAPANGAMHYLRCMHPRGGATALGAVVGGDAMRQPGFSSS